MIEFNNIQTALNNFEQAATKHADATEQGDYKVANACYTTISETVKFLKKNGKLSELKAYLNHSAIGVRIWAATNLLPVLESEAMETLEQIAKESGIHSLDAEITIREWKKGNLRG